VFLIVSLFPPCSSLVFYHEVSGKLLGFIADNAANNDMLTDKLEDRLENWDGQHNRVRCLAHVINLVTKATFWPFTPKKDSDEAEDDENETHDDEEAGSSSVLEPNAIYEQECDDISGEVDEESKLLLGELTEAERKMGENILKKIRGFGSAISKSNQKMTTLEEACTYHGIKFLRPIKVVKTRWSAILPSLVGQCAFAQSQSTNTSGLRSMPLAGKRLRYCGSCCQC